MQHNRRQSFLNHCTKCFILHTFVVTFEQFESTLLGGNFSLKFCYGKSQALLETLASGRISVGGDIIIDNEDKNMFKQEVVKLMCQVTLKSKKTTFSNTFQGVPEETHVILIFDCCRGSGDIEMNSSSTTSTSFQLTVRPSELSALKNRDFKNSYIFHVTLPHQVFLILIMNPNPIIALSLNLEMLALLILRPIAFF